jgi:hypothetical protein
MIHISKVRLYIGISRMITLISSNLDWCLLVISNKTEYTLCTFKISNTWCNTESTQRQSSCIQIYTSKGNCPWYRYLNTYPSGVIIFDYHQKRRALWDTFNPWLSHWSGQMMDLPFPYPTMLECLDH